MDANPGTVRSAPPGPGREEALFDAALALDPKARVAFLEAACAGDLGLRRRLEVLLQSHAQAGAFLEPASPESPGQPSGTVVLPPSERPGDCIGSYKLREKLGEGGCGVVYVAEQTAPVRRRVALKVIKLGMDTRTVVARFEAERQALALMDHPNIARVFDAGATATGRPYFVMELVRGIRITDYCDQNQLDIRQRLELFIQVCHAVQHAHQKGIIHRDLKPSNILVTLHDGVPVPKVIDFGIAKATEGRLTELTVYTELTQFIGTPAYTSPEQAEMSGLDIDTRSDIYSLGVLLYELLTGRTPFDAEDLLHAGLDQMRRTIREKEPPRPSTRLSTMLDAELTTVAKRHGAEPPRLIHLVRGDLDWIVMKALEKDRTRRFETASALAVDVCRFLANEPIEARPPSSLYRFQKLVRRNQPLFLAGAAVLASLVLGLGLSLTQFLKAREALQRAVLAERQQARLRRQAEEGLAIERKMREMIPIADKFTTAGLLLSRGQVDKAEELVRDVPPIAQGFILYTTFGMVHAQKGEWQAAMTNYARAIDVAPTNDLAYGPLALLLLQAGAAEPYQQHRQSILRRFANIADPEAAERLAKACLLQPLPASNLESTVKMLATVRAAKPADASWSPDPVVPGLGEYRHGQCDAAVKSLQVRVGQGSDPAVKLQAMAIVAMAQHQLSQAEEARATLAQARELAGKELATLAGPNWNDRVAAQLLLQEAQALIQPTVGHR